MIGSWISIVRRVAILLTLLCAATAVWAQDVNLDEGLIGYWKLDGDATDASGLDNHGRVHGVDFTAVDRNGQPNGAAKFDGIDDCIEVLHNDSLWLGPRPFTISAWVNVEEDIDDVIGDIMSKYDEDMRRGFNLYIKGSSATYNGHSDAKNVHFGIDNGVDGPWEDCGKIWPSNTYISSLTVHDGALYAGEADALEEDKGCRVFRYAGGTEWEDCGRVSPSNRTRSVYSMISHKGDLYAGTGHQDWQTVSPATRDKSRVYRYAGGTEWVDCGQLGDNYRVLSLASFKGDLYAGTDVTGGAPRGPNTGKVYRYAGGTEWVDCGRLGDQHHVFTLVAHNGQLYGGTNGDIFRYEGGTEWTYIGRPLGNTQVHCLEVYKGHLYTGTWPDGKVCRYEGGTQWSDCGDLGVSTKSYQINEVNALAVYNGKLYAGSIPLAQVYRYNGYRAWDMVGQLVHSPDYAPAIISSWNRVPCLTVFGGQIYAGTGSCRGNPQENPLPEHGRVYRMQAGQNASYDRDLGTGWKHIAAVKGPGVQLYVDGELAAKTPGFTYSEMWELGNREPLMIGFGAVDYFSGTMDDVRLYNRALDQATIQALAR